MTRLRHLLHQYRGVAYAVVGMEAFLFTLAIIHYDPLHMSMTSFLLVHAATEL